MGTSGERPTSEIMDGKTTIMNHQFSFWEREEWLKSIDLLIIGGGIVGASTALFYKQQNPDADVLIVEKGFVPEGASTRNAGFTCIGSISEHLADMEIAGQETVFNRIERRWRGLNLLKQTLGEAAIGYEHCGGYEIFTDESVFEKCCDQISFMNNRLKERLDLDEVYKRQFYEGYPAIYNHVEGAINSGKMMRFLHKKLSGLGVRTWWNCNVDNVESGKVIFGSGLEMYPKTIAIAVNGFSARLLDVPIQPARGFVMITRPVENLKWRGTFNYNKGYVYFRNVENRLLIGGARHIAKDEETTDQFGINKKIKEWLTRFADDVLKLPGNWKPEMEWSGVMGFTENKEPLVKNVQDGVWVAAGLSGMGIAIGMEVARGLVKKIVDG